MSTSHHALRALFSLAWRSAGKRRANRALAGLVLLLGLNACGDSAEVRWRMTVRVEDRGVVREYSRIWSNRLSEAAMPLASPYNGKFVGEAIPIELPGRPTLFALTVGSYRDGPVWQRLSTLPEIIFRSQLPAEKAQDRVALLREVRRRPGMRADLPCAPPREFLCPTFVYFDDLKDETTIKVVNPHALPEEVFRGAKILSVSIEVVEEKPAFDSKSFPALDRSKSRSWWARLPANDPRKIDHDAFRSK